MATHTYNTASGLTVTGGTGGTSGNPIPTGSAIEYVQNSDDGLGLDSAAFSFSSGASSLSACGIELKFMRLASGMEIQARRSALTTNGDVTSSYSRKYAVGGSYTNLTTSAFDSADDVWQILQSAYTPTHIKMKYSQSTLQQYGSNSSSVTFANSYVNDTWLATNNTGDNITVEFANQAAAGSGAMSGNNITWVVEFWGRVSGYDDTKLWQIRVDLDSEADSP